MLITKHRLFFQQVSTHIFPLDPKIAPLKVSWLLSRSTSCLFHSLSPGRQYKTNLSSDVQENMTVQSGGVCDDKAHRPSESIGWCSGRRAIVESEAMLARKHSWDPSSNISNQFPKHLRHCFPSRIGRITSLECPLKGLMSRVLKGSWPKKKGVELRLFQNST